MKACEKSRVFTDLLSNSPKRSPWFSTGYEGTENLFYFLTVVVFVSHFTCSFVTLFVFRSHTVFTLLNLGRDGRDGRDGIVGPPGPPGKLGPRGIPGKQGQKGNGDIL